MLFSGRTSRLEIRKLLGECLFWRFKRTKSARHDMKYPTHAFLVDDDDEDTDRSIQTKGPTPYSSLTVQSSNRHNDLSPKTSSGNFSSQQSRASTTSLYNCCGLTIDLSHRDPYSKSAMDDTPAQRSKANKRNSNQTSLPAKTATSTQSSISKSIPPSERTFRQQRTVSYRPTYPNRPITRRRATTVVHCSEKSGSTPVTTVESEPLIVSNVLHSTVERSLSKGNLLSFSGEPSPIVDTPSLTDAASVTELHETEAAASEHTDCKELLLPAYIIERC